MWARAAAISASPSGAPCTSWVPALLGEPRPITVLQQISVGLVGDGLGGSSAAFERRRIMAVDVRHHVPAIGFEALRRVVGEPAFDMAVDGNAVVVPEGGQLAQAPGAGQRAGLVRNAFHQAAVAEENIGAVIDDLVAGAVELVGQQLLGHGHADGVGDALAQRAGGGLDAGCVAVLGVARRLAVQLAEILQVVDRQLVAGQVQQRIEQHRAVAVGQHEAVAVGPLRVGRVVAQVAVPQHFGDLGHAHGRAGMAGIGLLHAVHGEGADGVGQRGADGGGQAERRVVMAARGKEGREISRPV
jgi:hypothetical protein